MFKREDKRAEKFEERISRGPGRRIFDAILNLFTGLFEQPLKEHYDVPLEKFLHIRYDNI
ncbi:hypothetical protein ACIQZI_10130 [Peribacillus sp. NPDC096379]|uniref:hypothetical protein n=1 Tax=Peribacillus sp. NPDC096379 TaxID=3364393 RepID=UPI0038096310